MTDTQMVRMPVYHNVALLGGLALAHVLGTPLARLDPAVGRMKQMFRETVAAAVDKGAPC